MRVMHSSGHSLSAATLICIFLCMACSGKATGNTETDTDTLTAGASVPEFNADSAYSYVRQQTSFGPRVPGSDAHARTVEWLTEKLRSFGADTVMIQTAEMASVNGMLPVRNIFARFNSKAPSHLLFLAHYDTRPWADEDPDEANHNKPIDGANDGASGVGVLLEMARIISMHAPQTGIDILFADTEDSGKSAPDDADLSTQKLYDASWCLGSQYFVKNMPYAPGSLPKVAILLDMVGARNAVFPREYFSAQAAPGWQKRISDAAARAGYGDRFPQDIAGAVNDDHVPFIQSGIPAVDIIEIGHPQTGSFNPVWHTLQDNIDNIDPATLKAVGSTIISLIYSDEVL